MRRSAGFGSYFKRPYLAWLKIACLSTCLALGCREQSRSPSSSSQASAASHGGANGSARSGGAAAIDHQAAGVIVVLGSSTAAGTGPSKPERAWVERYRTYLKQQFPKFSLTNLAVGGYTTYQMQPSDYTPPLNRPSPVPEHNITFALGLKPDAIIINMPSNDAANKYPLSEQMSNYDRVVQLARQHGAPVWITTSQPRNFGDDAQRTLLVLARDAIRAKYTDHALDFWSRFAEADGEIKPSYDSGDGTHMNDAAHALLVQQVIAAKIPEATLSTP
jgi:lysophospholipase L1-like esterase